MWTALASIFTGGGLGAIERIASEVIETDKESAEAKALWIKTLDPNGKMRRDLSKFASRAYGFYLIAMTILIFIHAYEIGDASNSKEALDAMIGLFTPITTAWGAIVTASFGVNATNVIKNRGNPQ
ncbi:MAG: hypothetical protein KJO69_01650 [Gammaproteobacteria bacterium]|nr:hypothetical protein [Gammaproteobacteria bacterium]